MNIRQCGIFAGWSGGSLLPFLAFLTRISFVAFRSLPSTCGEDQHGGYRDHCKKHTQCNPPKRVIRLSPPTRQCATKVPMCYPLHLWEGWMRWREFIAALGGAAAWPVVVLAQQGDRMRRIGVLMNLTPDDPEAQTRVAALSQGLQELSWTIGRNVLVDFRWRDTNGYRRQAEELIALPADVIVASTTPALAAAQQATRTIPTVFVNVVDPVALGMVRIDGAVGRSPRRNDRAAAPPFSGSGRTISRDGRLI